MKTPQISGFHPTPHRPYGLATGQEMATHKAKGEFHDQGNNVKK
jgi:hypothetical protein